MKRFAAVPMSLLLAIALGAGVPAYAKKPQEEASSQLPKGLQKKAARGGELPPGWEKKLKKGEVLDQAVVSHGTPVPDGVRLKLPVGSRGSVDITLDGKVIRLEEASRKVLDVFEMKL